jgi:hypothetical protein
MWFHTGNCRFGLVLMGWRTAAEDLPGARPELALAAAESAPTGVV